MKLDIFLSYFFFFFVSYYTQFRSREISQWHSKFQRWTPAIKRELKGSNYPRVILELTVQKREVKKNLQQTRSTQEKTLLN